MESYFEITIQKPWFGLIIAVFFNILLITRLDSIHINHSRWRTSSTTTISIKEIIFFSKHDLLQNTIPSKITKTMDWAIEFWFYTQYFKILGTLLPYHKFRSSLAKCSFQKLHYQFWFFFFLHIVTLRTYCWFLKSSHDVLLKKFYCI